MKELILINILLLMLLSTNIYGQNKPEFTGQISALGNYSPDSKQEVLFSGRYLPELNYKIKLDSTRGFDFDAAANISGTVSFHPFSSSNTTGDIHPYRLWARYTGKRYEVRLGLQKIDFGSATLLRPLQWFNQIDPRDPLQLTNGVYGALGRYYFPNNANIWLWTLYGNEKTRGFDAVETNKKIPEFGGRFQYPVPKGEVAISYHHRTADSRDLTGVPAFKKIPEDRIGLDGKWDVGVGLWFEASYIHKSKDVGLLTNQALLTLGTDYTFGVGNGLNVVLEHLVTSGSEKPFHSATNSNFTATNMSYPFGLSNTISTVMYYDWSGKNFTFFLNLEHQFKKITGYVMGYYNPKTQQGILTNDLLNTFSGPGIQLMLVYNY